MMIKDVSRCRHHSNGTFHFSSNCWNLEKQICHYIYIIYIYIRTKGCMCVCNNNVPLVFLCSISIKKSNSHIRQKENMLWNIERRRHSINDALPVWLRNEQFFLKNNTFDSDFDRKRKGHHDTGWAFDLVPGAPVQSEKNPILTK